MLTTEERIQEGVNEAGMLATQYALQQYDTDGSAITVENKKYTSKGQISKTCQCPFGEFELCRHVYQSTSGGKTCCPLDSDARIIIFSTPKFAKMVSSEYTYGGSLQVHRDLKENHSRLISRNYIQDISQSVGELAYSKRAREYGSDVEKEEVSSTGISLDGTYMLMREDGWRQAMAGSISYYDENGERLHTSYISNSPEYGKETFYKSFQKEIAQVQKKFKGKTFVGVADGASDNWTFLEPYVECQVLDFFHAGEYLSRASKAVFKRKTDGKEWLTAACHRLKHEEEGAKKSIKRDAGISKKENHRREEKGNNPMHNLFHKSYSSNEISGIFSKKNSNRFRSNRSGMQSNHQTTNV